MFDKQSLKLSLICARLLYLDLSAVIFANFASQMRRCEREDNFQGDVTELKVFLHQCYPKWRERAGGKEFLELTVTLQLSKLFLHINLQFVCCAHKWIEKHAEESDNPL